jgi:phytoene dehydrogenase-like protein
MPGKNTANQRDIVIIGGGHNGLVTAFYLAKAGYKPLLLERRPQVGGAAITDEFHPGFRCSTLAHTAGPIRPDIVRDLKLEKHGLQLITPAVSVTALTPDGRALSLYQDARKSAQEVAAFSQKDAAKYPEFQESLGKMGRVIGEALATPPPNIDHPSSGDLWGMLKTGRAIRNLGRKDMYRLLRWGPMAVADLAAEYFETELLRAVVAARGLFGTFLGPWSAGSALVLLIRAAGDAHPAGSAFFAAGGMGALTQAMASAAQAAGAEIRSGAEVIEIRVKDGAASGVILSTGEEIDARAVISNADPKRTLLKLTDPTHLTPDFVQKLQHYRGNGTVAKVNLALSALPSFTALKNRDAAALTGRIHIGNEIDYLERAFDASKYGNFSPHPYLEVTIPSLTDPTLAPEGQHVMSIYVQYAPYKLNGDWETDRG